jgi:hypothetical protein
MSSEWIFILSLGLVWALFVSGPTRESPDTSTQG